MQRSSTKTNDPPRSIRLGSFVARAVCHVRHIHPRQLTAPRPDRLRRRRPRACRGSCRDLLDALAEVVDPRKRRGIRHRLLSILALAAAAVVAGARSYVAAGQ
ncbi:MAG: transposase family protein [Pseudonocardiaceae bacterium]